MSTQDMPYQVTKITRTECYTQTEVIEIGPRPPDDSKEPPKTWKQNPIRKFANFMNGLLTVLRTALAVCTLWN